jgi:L-rhamnose mutarotase
MSDFVTQTLCVTYCLSTVNACSQHCVFLRRVLVWFVPDTFVIRPHAIEELPKSHQHFNNIRTNIKFTMEYKQIESITFQDVLVTKTLDGILGHSVYGKLTHTDLYVHAKYAKRETWRRALKKQIRKMWTEFIWFIIGTRSGRLWAR